MMNLTGDGNGLDMVMMPPALRRDKKTQRQGRTFIRIEATPKSPETRALLREFKAGVSELEKKWKAHIRAQKKQE